MRQALIKGAVGGLAACAVKARAKKAAFSRINFLAFIDWR